MSLVNKPWGKIRINYKIGAQYSPITSPLFLFSLAACGGGGGGGGGELSTGSTTVSGSAIAGPINGAIAFIDLDNDGTLDLTANGDASDEPYTYTDSNGFYSLETTNTTAPIVVTTDSATAGNLNVSAVDTSADTLLTGITLKAPRGAGVVSPLTTVAYDLIENSGFSEAEVATALGLESVSILSFNPYEAGVDADDALATEKVASQLMTTVKAIAAAASGTGADEDAAASKGFEALSATLDSKVRSNDVFDLKNTTDLAVVKTNANSKLSGLSGIDNTAFGAILDTAMNSVKLVNEAIFDITDTDLSSNATKGTFATAELLKEQIQNAAAAEKASTGAGAANITLTNATSVTNAATAAASNNAPTDINLSSQTFDENTSSLTLSISTIDDSSTNFSYGISGVDASYFTLDSNAGEITLTRSPDFEVKSSYDISIRSSDDAAIPKSFSKSFSIAVNDVNEAPVFDVSNATSTVAENAAQGTTIFTASATDPDSIKSIVYSISGGAHADLVQIDGETGAVTVIDSPNIDSNPLYEFVVTASDSDDSNLSSSQSVTVLVTEASALPTSQNKTIGLTENSTKYFAASDFAFFDENVI